MLAKLTSKNQLTLPKAAVEALGASECCDVAVHEGQIVLTPVRIQRGDAVRAKLAALGLGEGDVADAVKWVRSGTVVARVAEPAAEYKKGGVRGRTPRSRKKTARGQ